MNPPVATGAEPCRTSPDEWFPEKGDPHTAEMVKRLCASCPILNECRDWGIRHERYGIWGGLSSTDRKKIRSRMGIVLDSPRVVVFDRLPPISHGTEGGYQQHLRRNQPINEFDSCGCRRAQQRARADRKKRAIDEEGAA